MAPTGITMILSHDDWSLVTEKYSRDELRVVMRSRLASPDLDREYVIGEVTTKEPRVLNYLVRAMRSRPRTFRVELVDVVRGRGN
ncbi:hypothetical protein HS1genome_1983 [Sulfodiicoccus acidiphilus]|uniref:Uncharacterized protein n=1 Tax=Sulfodiicoccus acidiphilus TaxID=1670455 RepID=A0A348B5Z2_9CREN|nr:hypothetical protein [Sulfodiicoccus acidiphilus]BBD73594.1 hypothetical protein HS1genome_1983 [Sulfodiicoccus acidiphilus]